MNDLELLLAKILIFAIFLTSAWSLGSYYGFLNINRDSSGATLYNKIYNYSFDNQKVEVKNKLSKNLDNREIYQRIHLYINNNGFQPNNFQVTAGKYIEISLESLDNNTYNLLFLNELLNEEVVAVGPYGIESVKFITPEKEGVYFFKSHTANMPIFYGKMTVSKEDK
jgi:hypothetical protein